MDARRNKDGEFQFQDNYLAITPVTDQYFSLLKLKQEHETNFSLGCLIATFNPHSKYIQLTPVDCEYKIANDYLCTMNHTECNAKVKVSEQLDLQFDPIFKEEQSNGIQQKQNYIADIFTKLKISLAFQNMFSILWHAKTPCFAAKDNAVNSNSIKTILRDCKWKGQTVACSSIFSQFPTDKGMCCSFNMKAAEEIFQGETYVQLVDSLQNVDMGQTLDEIKFPSLTNLIHEINPGKSKGLSVVLGSL